MELSVCFSDFNGPLHPFTDEKCRGSILFFLEDKIYTALYSLEVICLRILCVTSPDSGCSYLWTPESGVTFSELVSSELHYNISS